MNTFNTAGKSSFAAMALCMAFAFGSNQASAAHWGLDVGVSAPVYSGGYYGGGYGYGNGGYFSGGYNSGYNSGGHYETRCESILVCPERTERRWVEPVYQTVYQRGYAENVIVRPGYWTTVCIPARYENRCSKVWVANTCHGGGGYGYGFGYGYQTPSYLGFSYRR